MSCGSPGNKRESILFTMDQLHARGGMKTSAGRGEREKNEVYVQIIPTLNSTALKLAENYLYGARK